MIVVTLVSPRLSTDWDRYYTSVPPTAKLTRLYTIHVILQVIERYAAASHAEGLSIVEIGGANSCLLKPILAQCRCRSYDVIDTNQYGLSLLSSRTNESRIVRLHRADILRHGLDVAADVVFSVGLIEHFEPPETRAAILAHFDLLRPGGTAIITFPMPTTLYRLTRGVISAAGMWKFPDERPLARQEVASAIQEREELVWEKTLWPLLLTQHLMVARKRSY